MLVFKKPTKEKSMSSFIGGSVDIPSIQTLAQFNQAVEDAESAVKHWNFMLTGKGGTTDRAPVITEKMYQKKYVDIDKKIATLQHNIGALIDKGRALQGSSTDEKQANAIGEQLNYLTLTLVNLELRPIVNRIEELRKLAFPNES